MLCHDQIEERVVESASGSGVLKRYGELKRSAKTGRWTRSEAVGTARTPYEFIMETSETWFSRNAAWVQSWWMPLIIIKLFTMKTNANQTLTVCSSL